MISVLIPVFNSALFIKDTISSVLNQTYTNFELLIYDDCSYDNSLEIISAFSDKRIKLFKGDKNLGVRHARDFLLSKANGEFICFLDSDDLCNKNKLLKQINFFEKNPEIDILGSSVKYINENGKNIFLPLSFQSNSNDDIFVNLFFTNTIATSSVMFRYNVKFDINFLNFPYSISEDYFIWTRLSFKYKITNLIEPLTLYRISGNSLMHNARNDYKDSLNLIHSSYFDIIGLNKYFLKIHNSFLYENPLSIFYLKKSIIYFEELIYINTIFNKTILIKQIRINWFRRCVHLSKHKPIKSFISYFVLFKYHNFQTIMNGSILAIISLFYITKNTFSLKVVITTKKILK